MSICQFFGSMISVFTLNSILSAYNGHPGDFTFNGLINFGRFGVSNHVLSILCVTFCCVLLTQNSSYYWYEIPIFCAMGVFGELSATVAC